ncbi:MAG: sigma-70 region 4 domain-containing protein, partial [Pedobacter sp.]|nr:sigma-70 region 4 domain-containing protein [Pedobacter sp.]
HYIDHDFNYADHRIRERDLATIIEKEISCLPAKMREVFELSRKSHLSHKEIAILLDLSELTVRTQVKKALRILRLKLGLLIYLLILFKIY